jgi:hypothetical protein
VRRERKALQQRVERLLREKKMDADGRFDLAQYHLRDGDEARPVIELREAAGALAVFIELGSQRCPCRDVAMRISTVSESHAWGEA